MNVFAVIIIGMWLLPVILSIILPLSMLSFWLLGRLILSNKSDRPGVAMPRDSMKRLPTISPVRA